MKKEQFVAASGAEPVVLELLQEVPDLKSSAWEHDYRAFYAAQGERFVTALYEHAPGGLVDAIFVEMAKRAAGILRVPK